jgi:hypothetical protein
MRLTEYLRSTVSCSCSIFRMLARVRVGVFFVAPHQSNRRTRIGLGPPAKRSGLIRSSRCFGETGFACGDSPA